MNVFRLTGDICHMFAKFILLYKLIVTRSATGVSGKTQKLYLLVFIARYLDLFSYFVSWYNSIAKVFYILSSALTVFLIHRKYAKTYEKDKDSFLSSILPIVCIVLAFTINHHYDCLEVLWTFSIYLEVVVMIPQLYMIYYSEEIKEYMALYLIPMGVYKTFYIFNWIWRYEMEGGTDLIADVSGLVQTLIYYTFFLMYITGFRRRQEISDVDDPEVVEPPRQPQLKNNLKANLILSPETLEIRSKLKDLAGVHKV